MDVGSDVNFRKALNDLRWNEALITISSFNGALLFGERRCFSLPLFFALHEMHFIALPLHKKESPKGGR